jgi:hypothetical protein
VLPSLASDWSTVRKSFFILLALSVFLPACRGEARWCDITGHGDSDKMLYQPIAYAARVSGTVLTRITYSPQGDVKDVVNISGPPMLAKSVGEQLKSWHLRTNASGEDFCQSLVIIDFRIASDTTPPALPPQRAPRSILRISVEAVVVIPLTNDEAPTLTRKRRFLLF